MKINIIETFFFDIDNHEINNHGMTNMNTCKIINHEKYYSRRVDRIVLKNLSTL
jgi:hypothetical protein